MQGAPPAGNQSRTEDDTQTLPGAAKGGASSHDKDEAPWTPPAEFDEFRIQGVIGHGGMGVVYLAQDTSLGRDVAVKFLASREPDPTVIEYFATEARTIARLQHPNIVTVYRVGAVGGHPYIVSEHVVGKSLAQLPRPLPWRQVLTLGLGLARGLAAAHRQGILHRDVKPANALVTASGEVKLLDFGLAERIDRSMSLRSVGTQTLAGTPRYMAPELLRGAPATPQSDLYSLGLTLYELCTGSLPPHALAQKLPDTLPPQELVNAESPAEEAPPIPAESHVDPDFAALIMRCLAPVPSERFASAELLREALERLEAPHTAAPLTGNPYRGLAPFEVEHRALFFGRNGDILDVLDRLHRQPLVLVVGDPGVGKSSLCRAGVLPRAVDEALDEGRQLCTITLWPGRRPLHALASALAPLLGRKEAELVTAITETPDQLGQTLRELFHGRRGLLLFIDQLEELITLADPVQAKQFATVLGELALPSPGVRVLTAVRGDYLTSVCALPGLAIEVGRAPYILQQMKPERVREAIVGPARSRGVAFESEHLIDILVASTFHGTGSLPLLQFTLAELWEKRDPALGRITGRALTEMGGVAGALSRHADEVLSRLSPAEQQAARQMLVQLVTTGGRRVVRREDELVSQHSAASRAALLALAEGRLLHAHTEGGRARYEIAHDALMVSWGTLRNWLDDDIGHRAVRQRVEAASAEWERLTHARDALWGQRQLDEARPLDPSTLTPRAHAFLNASHRALRRQRWGRYLTAVLGAVALAAVYGCLRLQGYLEDSRFSDEQLAKAREALDASHAQGARASELREEALSMFDGQPPPSSSFKVASNPHDLRAAAERKWAQALEQLDQADESYVQATQFLERALDRRRGLEEARELLAESTYDRMLLAELFHQQRSIRELRGRLDRLLEDLSDREKWQKRLSKPAVLELVTEPPGAQVEIRRYVSDSQGVSHLGPPLPLGPTPIAGKELDADSYLLRITRPGHVPVDLPLLLTRGAREQIRLTLPADVPTGYVYIPPGCSLLGSADPEEVRAYMNSAPIHQLCFSEGFLIGRTEVTFGDWLDYLEDLPPDAPARHLLDQPRFNSFGAVTLRNEPGRGWVFSFYPSDTVPRPVPENEPFRYPDRPRNQVANWREFPLSGVSSKDLEAYFFWLSRKKHVSGARLCTEYEWERAARGADGRAYPHGDRLQLDDANIDLTYDRQPSSYGPDMVGAHPASVSPFGLLDMAGNAYEMTQPATQDLARIVLRGGAWYYTPLDARVASRSPGDPTLRDVSIGVRVCAPFSPR
ncbi:MAG: protein kinase domain-containing protein [Hyalangium sp.]|uniref:bifunctional serine/threonine-protein kinase/formylglycine-generating enzyme family protein n=1 Tax=Hyalangium sp. TaxID=2028555 RepID=UPI00389A0451